MPPPFSHHTMPLALLDALRYCLRLVAIADVFHSMSQSQPPKDSGLHQPSENQLRELHQQPLSPSRRKAEKISFDELVCDDSDWYDDFDPRFNAEIEKAFTSGRLWR